MIDGGRKMAQILQANWAKKGLHGVCEMYESIKNFSLKSLSPMCLYLFESIVYYWAAT